MPGGTSLEKLAEWTAWTLALAQDAIQQEDEQMAQIMYHQTSLQGCLFIPNIPVISLQGWVELTRINF